MLKESADGFQIVHSRRKKNVAEFEKQVAIDTDNNSNQKQYLFNDEGIGSSSPTESEESLGMIILYDSFV